MEEPPADNSIVDQTGDLSGEQEPPPVPEPVLIDWEVRKYEGLLLTYCRTVWLALRRWGRLDAEAYTYVTMRAGKRFRSFTVLVVLLALVLSQLVMGLYLHEQMLRQGGQDAAWAIYVGIAVGLVGTWIGLMMMSGAVAWFSCPKRFDTERQDRAIALSYYTCAPMALIVLVPVLLGAMLALLPPHAKGWAMRIFGAFLLALVVCWYTIALRAVYFLAGRSAPRTAVMAALLPIIWAAQIAIIALVPAGLAMWWVMWLSLG